jgi:small subunit ribosomal protein S18
MIPKPRRKKPRRSSDNPRFRGVTAKLEDLDYKNVAFLQRVTSAQGKLFSRKRTGLSADFQRKTALALKRARFLALMPFVS